MTTRSAKLYVTRGLPGSGKTTWAKSLEGAVRVNRDDLRQMLFGAEGVLPWDQEELVTHAQQSAVRAALKQDRTVIVDDTNLRTKYVRVWEQLAAEENAAFEVVDFFEVTLNQCISRDYVRMTQGGRWVTEGVIRMLHDKFLAQHGGVLPAYSYDTSTPSAVRQYEPDHSLPKAIIVDLDGTLANRRIHKDTMRGPFDWHRVYEDAPAGEVIAVVRAMYTSGYKVVYVSGRDEVCREDTQDWIHDFVSIPGPLLMRPKGDNRKDTVVKEEILFNEIAPHYNVVLTLDDRDSVVAHWRAMGLRCLQVQPGAF